MPKLFDYEETDPKTQESKMKQGLFSKLGTMLTYTAVGLKDPGRLAEIQAQNARAEQEFQMFQQRMDQQRQEAMMRMAENDFVNVNDVPRETAMSTPDNPQAIYNIPNLGKFIRQPNSGMVIPDDMELYGIASNGKRMYRKNPDIIADQKLKLQARKDLQNYASDANQALVALDKIEKYSAGLGDFKTGLKNQVVAKGKAFIDKFSKEENMTNYLGVVSQEFIPMARKLMEEKGPITEFDVARVEKGFGDVTTPLKTKKLLINELRNKVARAIKIKADLAGLSEEEFMQLNQSLQQKPSESDGKLSSDNLFEGL